MEKYVSTEHMNQIFEFFFISFVEERIIEPLQGKTDNCLRADDTRGENLLTVGFTARTEICFRLKCFYDEQGCCISL